MKRARTTRSAIASTTAPTAEDAAASHRWHVYLLECEDGTLYTGIAKDVCERFMQHLAGKGAAYTRSHPPSRVKASREFAGKGAALRAEYAIKQLPRGQKLAFFEAGEQWEEDGR